MEVIFSHLFQPALWNLQAWNWFATKQAIFIITTSSMRIYLIFRQVSHNGCFEVLKHILQLRYDVAYVEMINRNIKIHVLIGTLYLKNAHQIWYKNIIRCAIKTAIINAWELHISNTRKLYWYISSTKWDKFSSSTRIWLWRSRWIAPLSRATIIQLLLWYITPLSSRRLFLNSITNVTRTKRSTSFEAWFPIPFSNYCVKQDT